MTFFEVNFYLALILLSERAGRPSERDALKKLRKSTVSPSLKKKIVSPNVSVLPSIALES